jgi:hypothetical protein
MLQKNKKVICVIITQWLSTNLLAEGKKRTISRYSLCVKIICLKSVSDLESVNKFVSCNDVLIKQESTSLYFSKIF